LIGGVSCLFHPRFAGMMSVASATLSAFVLADIVERCGAKNARAQGKCKAKMVKSVGG
jgi:hypothetical protein